MRSVIAKGRAKDSGFCSEAPHGAVRSEKAQSLWLPKRLVLLCGQTFAAGADCPWRGVMLRIVRLAMETIIFSR